MKNFIFVLILLLAQVTIAQNAKIVRVHSARELIEAIENNTIIIIDLKKLDISGDSIGTLLKYNNSSEVPSNAKVYYVPNEGLTIKNIRNLTINSEDTCNLFANKQTDNVIRFENCKDISLSNFRIYHIPQDSGAYTEATVQLCNVENFYGNNLELSNGKTGLSATLSANIQLYKIRFSNNHTSAISIFGCNKVNIESSTFDSNNAQALFELNDVKSADNIILPSTITLSNSEIYNNTIQQFFNFDLDQTSLFTVENCNFHNNNIANSKINDEAMNAEFETTWNKYKVEKTEFPQK